MTLCIIMAQYFLGRQCMLCVIVVTQTFCLHVHTYFICSRTTLPDLWFSRPLYTVKPRLLVAHGIRIFSTDHKVYENIKRKGEIAHEGQILLFPEYFSIVSINFPPFLIYLKLLSANSSDLRQSRFVRLNSVDRCPYIKGHDSINELQQNYEASTCEVTKF